MNEEEFKTKYDELITRLENKGCKPSYEKILSLVDNMKHDFSYEEILSLVENMGHESSMETKKKEKKSMTTKKMTMRKLRLQQRLVSISGTAYSDDNLYGFGIHDYTFFNFYVSYDHYYFGTEKR